MTQSKRSSAAEAVANGIVGILLSTAMNYFLVPLMFGAPANAPAAVAFTAIFTLASIMRSFVIRRAFNRWSAA